MDSFITALSDTFNRARHQRVISDFKVNGDLAHAKAVHTIPVVSDLFHAKTQHVRESGGEDFLKHLVAAYPTDMQSVEAAGTAYGIFFLCNYYQAHPVIPPTLAMGPYCEAVFDKFDSTHDKATRAQAKKFGLQLIKHHLKSLGAATPKDITLQVMKELIFAFYPMAAGSTLDLQRSGASMVICLALGSLRQGYKKENLRKLADGEVKSFRAGAAAGTIQLKRSPDALRLAAAFSTINCRVEWHEETLVLLRAMARHRLLAVKPASQPAPSFADNGPNPREIFFANKFAQEARAKGLRTKKGTEYDWKSVRRLQRAVKALDGKAAADKMAERKRHLGIGPSKVHSMRRTTKCPHHCKGTIVVMHGTGDRICDGCGAVVGRGVHGQTKDIIDVDTGENYCHHAPLDPHVQSTFFDADHRGMFGLKAALRRTLAQREDEDYVKFGVKLATIEKQKIQARSIYETLAESGDLPDVFAHKASALFNAYRMGPGLNCMNFFEVGIACTLNSLPPATPPCIGTCDTVALIGGVALSSPESLKIADHLGNQRGGLKLSTLKSKCSVNFLGRDHVFQDQHGHTVAVPVDSVIRLRGMCELPQDSMLRIYATSGKKVVSHKDINARSRRYFRGTLDLAEPCDALHVEVYTREQVRRPGCMPKMKKEVLFERHLSLSGPWKWTFPNGSLAMQAWTPRVTLTEGCGARFTTLYEMKHHCCSTHKRKNMNVLTGRKKRARI